MCRFRVLKHLPEGYVAYNKQQGRYEVAFMTTLLRLNSEATEGLLNALADRLERHRTEVCHRAKIFHFGACQAVHMVLCYSEMEVLHAMLEEALVEQSVQELLEG